MSQPDLPGAGPGPVGGDQMLPEGTYGVILDASGDAGRRSHRLRLRRRGAATARPPGRRSTAARCRSRPSSTWRPQAAGPGYRAAAYRPHRRVDVGRRHPADGAVQHAPAVLVHRRRGDAGRCWRPWRSSRCSPCGEGSGRWNRSSRRPRRSRPAICRAGSSETDPRTEVGRLGASLNVMLGRIEEAMDERRESEEALRRFLADASHELRTPLTSIRGYAELFRRGASDDPADTALAMRRIEQEGERMGVLVEDLLFLARAGQGRPIAHEPVDLVRVATDAVHDARAVDPSRTIELETPDALTVTGDEGRLRQVLANLLSNALTHTPAGHVGHGAVARDATGRRDRGERRRAGTHGRRGRTCLRAVLPRGSRARARPAGRRTGRGERNRARPRDRGGDRRGTRRERERRESAGTGREVHGSPPAGTRNRPPPRCPSRRSTSTLRSDPQVRGTRGRRP